MYLHTMTGNIGSGSDTLSADDVAAVAERSIHFSLASYVRMYLREDKSEVLGHYPVRFHVNKQVSKANQYCFVVVLETVPESFFDICRLDTFFDQPYPYSQDGAQFVSDVNHIAESIVHGLFTVMDASVLVTLSDGLKRQIAQKALH